MIYVGVIENCLWLYSRTSPTGHL